jgi:NADPH-dependent glutamate synthase beta subunit-like oxidoreductase
MGAVKNKNQIWIGTKNAAGLKEAECRFCGACVEVCPTGALLDKDDVPEVRHDSPLPCVKRCPAGIDIPTYLRLITEGRYNEAMAVIRSRVPFPGILGYVCFHPCEDSCRRSIVDQSVAICDLKRFVADKVPLKELSRRRKQPESNRKVAIIGSGPTGLTAAYYLKLLGHQADIFDTADKPGGMLRHAIPDFRLPPEVLDRELEELTDIGVNFFMNSPISGDLKIPELKSKGYDAILVATGTPTSKSLRIENSDLENIFSGLDFLKSAKLKRKPKLSGDVVVIGGGNAAIDAAMTALRLGANTVKLVCLESKIEMPAHDWEIVQAEEEGIVIINSWGPKRFLAENGRLAGIELKKCTRVFDGNGRFDPQYDNNDLQELPANYVIISIGQGADKGLTELLADLADGSNGQYKADSNFATNIDGIFAAGDFVRGPSSVVEAIADGRQVADVIDRYIGGKGIPDTTIEPEGIDNPVLDSSNKSINRERLLTTIADPIQRTSNFDLISKTYDEDTAQKEAQRCLQCNLRLMITSTILPPYKWLVLNRENIEKVPHIEGVFQLLDADKKVIRITGVINLYEKLQECLANAGEIQYFIWEADPMYTKRESELIQQYLQKHGELPGGGLGDEMDDLF